MASLPKDKEPESLTLDEAKELLEAKASKGKKKGTSKKKTTSKKTTKKTTSKTKK